MNIINLNRGKSTNLLLCPPKLMYYDIHQDYVLYNFFSSIK